MRAPHPALPFYLPVVPSLVTFPWCPPFFYLPLLSPSLACPFTTKNADRSEVFQTDTAAKDADRYRVADTALSDTHRKYHFVLLHFTDADSQVRAIASP